MLLFGHLANLIKITLKHCSVWHILGGLRKLEKNHTGANLREAHDDSGDGDSSAMEASE